MDGLLFWIEMSMACLLGVAVTVALWEHFRASRSVLPDEPVQIPTQTPMPVPHAQSLEVSRSEVGRVAQQREVAPAQEA